MALAEYPVNLADLRFALFEWIKVEDRLGWDAETVDAFLQAAAKFAQKEVAPTNVAGDREGCRLDGAAVRVPECFHRLYRRFEEDGWFAAGAPEEWGGQALPKTVHTAIDEIMIGANPAFHNYVGLTRASANMLRAVGSEDQQRRYLPHLVSGHWQGTMCLTEPGAGSDVGASLTRATPRPDGRYAIRGVKSFITSGDHDMAENIVHAVLARIAGDPEGVKGLSLFLVPKFEVTADGALGARNDIVCSKVEEKMGIHGSVTTTLNFGDQGACTGELIGGRGEGIKTMFLIMNEERLAVGAQGHTLGAVMYLYALDYAKDRVQGTDIGVGKSMVGRKVAIIEHPDVRRMLLTIKGWTEATRALLVRSALEIDLAERAADADTRARHDGMAAFLTPICKAWGSDVGFQACSLALQVYGGYGYIAEYPAEQYLRDARISALYEGTNGIQAIDLLFRKVGGSRAAILAPLAEELTAFIGRHARHPALGAEVQALGRYAQQFSKVNECLLGRMAAGRLRETALGATPYLAMCGNLLGAYFLLDQAVVAAAQAPAGLPADLLERRARLADDPRGAFYDAKVQTAKFFVHQLLPQNDWLAAQCQSEDASALAAAL